MDFVIYVNMNYRQCFPTIYILSVSFPLQYLGFHPFPILESLQNDSHIRG